MRVALFVTCLVHLLRPSVGFSAIRLLEAGGCTVCVPRTQTCYGQPAFNLGDRTAALALARKAIADAESGRERMQHLAVAPGWSKGHDFPAPQGRAFRDLYAS